MDVRVLALLGVAACQTPAEPLSCADYDADGRAYTFYGYAQTDDSWLDLEVHAGNFDPPVLFDDAVTVAGARVLDVSPESGYITFQLVPDDGVDEITVTGDASCDDKGTPWVATVLFGDTGGFEVKVAPAEQ